VGGEPCYTASTEHVRRHRGCRDPRPSLADRSGVITDYPHEFRRSLGRKNYPLAPLGDAKRVMKCLEKHNQYTADKLDGKGY
jgi:hypothetical protein